MFIPLGAFSSLSKALYRICLTHESELGSLVWVQEEHPSLPSPCVRQGCRKSPQASAQSERAVRSSPGFLYDRRASFSFGRRGCLSSPRVRAWVAGSRLGCRKSPRASARSERAIRSFPVFFVRPSRILFVRKEGLFAEPLSASLGRWVSARLQEELPSLCTEREGGQEFSWLFMRPSRILFARKEGWNMPGYPWWAQAVTLPVSYYRVSPSGGPCPIR